MCGKEMESPGYCGRCAEEIAFLQQLHRKNGDKRVARKPMGAGTVVLTAAVIALWAYIVWEAAYPFVLDYYLRKGGY
jgi:hypothetical protein